MNNGQNCESLPQNVTQKLAEFCAAGKSGSLQLDIKEGRIIIGKLTETLHVDKARRIDR